MRGRLAVLLAIGAAAAVTIAVAQEPDDVPRPRGTPSEEPLPAPRAALPRRPAQLAATLTGTTERLREAVERWDPAGPVPREVTYLALHQQRPEQKQ